MFSSLHAAFSFGVLAGAGAAAAAPGVPALPFLAASALVGAVGVAVLAPGLLRDRGVPGVPLFARPSRRLAAMGVIAPIAATAVLVPVVVAIAQGERPSGLQAVGAAIAPASSAKTV